VVRARPERSAQRRAEQLKPGAPDVETLLTYGPSNGWLDAQPAALTHQVGKGRITYIAAWLDDDLMRAAAQWMLRSSGVEPAFGPVPDGVEVCRRTGPGKRVYIVINHTRAPQHIALPRPMQPVLSGGPAVEALDLAPRGVEVLR
jgi:beta-galactosidase